jgi:hypothetical protein
MPMAMLSAKLAHLLVAPLKHTGENRGKLALIERSGRKESISILFLPSWGQGGEKKQKIIYLIIQ